MMKSLVAVRWVLVVVVFAIVIWMTGGADKHYVDVYIGPDGHIYTHALGPQSIDPLFVVPGDYVVWNNPTDTETTITFEHTAWFGVDKVTVGAYQREILQFGGGEDGSLTVTNGDESGNPDLKVGEDP